MPDLFKLPLAKLHFRKILIKRKDNMLDSFGRDINYLRLSVTDRCNLRCRYCMPESGLCSKLSHSDMLTEEESIMAVRAAAELGFRKVRITGGEPLVKKNILSLCEKTASTPGIKEVCLTTNAIALEKMALDLKKAGVGRLNISLDTLSPEKYAYMTRGGDFHAAMRGIEKALEVGFSKIKINAVLIGGFNDDEIVPLAELTKKYPVDVRFIELMPFEGCTDFKDDSYISDDVVMKALPEAKPLPSDGSVAKLIALPGAKGNVGLISALSDKFCGNCNRMRLTSDGRLKPCLHCSDEYSIKGLGYDDMLSVMKEAIEKKPPCRPRLSNAEKSASGRSMNTIGG